MAYLNTFFNIYISQTILVRKFSVNLSCKDYLLLSYIPGFLKTGLAKISSHSTTWQIKTTKLIQRPIKSLYMTPGSALQSNQVKRSRR